jgi:glutaredoxin
MNRRLMNRRRFLEPHCWLMAIGSSVLFLGSTACGDLDLSSALSAAVESTDAAEPTQAASTTGGSRSPDMESIGPDSAQRIYYQFIDDRGRVQFVERLSDVPDAWRDQVGYVEMSQPPPLTPQEARKTWRVSADRATEIKLASATNASSAGVGRTQREDVILYSATWCGYCTKARVHLDSEGIDYELRDVDNDANSRELREKTGRGGIPVLDFSGEILRGYRSDAYDKAIRTIRG